MANSSNKTCKVDTHYVYIFHWGCEKMGNMKNHSDIGFNKKGGILSKPKMNCLILSLVFLVSPQMTIFITINYIYRKIHTWFWFTHMWCESSNTSLHCMVILSFRTFVTVKMIVALWNFAAQYIFAKGWRSHLGSWPWSLVSSCQWDFVL